jgi:hypothetical protein
MPGSTFQTNPYDLDRLLQDCHRGVLQLPDFQRSWVWDEDRIRSLIASISRAFPVGALMTLETGGEVNFKPRPVEGAPPEAKPDAIAGGTWEAMERVLRKAGYFNSGLRKLNLARSVAAHMDIHRNRSRSIQAFATAVVSAMA